MNQPNNKDQGLSFKNLLEKLQEDSWQLELLVSGFAIVLVVGAYEPLRDLNLSASLLSLSIERNFFFQLPVLILFFGWLSLLVNLTAHVLFRGLWISTIGLRYVSGEVDYEALKLSPRFRKFLERKIGSFDRYIEGLENLCSIIFAFTFLIIFSFISFGLYIILVGAVSNFLQGLEDIIGEKPSKFITVSTGIFLLISGLIYFIDFITLGFFKRKRWTARWYMPIYRFMSLITLSFIYRPIYYNLIDNRFGRRIGFLMVPYIVILGLIATMEFTTHPFFPEKEASHLRFRADYYDDLREERSLVTTPSLPSPYIGNGYLELFIPYMPIRDDERIKNFCPGFSSGKKTRLGTDVIIINTGKEPPVDYRAKADSSFLCLTGIYRVTVDDSLFQAIDYDLYAHPNQEEKGLRAILDVAFLNRGRHELLVEKLQADSIAWDTFSIIPFWVE